MRARVFGFCLALSACAIGVPQRPPELEAAHRRLEQETNSAAPALALSQIYLHQGDYLRARQYLTLAERFPLAGAEKRSAFRLGVLIVVRAGQYDEAVLRCRRQLELEEDPHVRVLLASIFEATNRWADAELERKLILSAWPEDKHQLIEMARFYQRSGQPDGGERAAELYQRYLASAPTGPEAAQARAALQTISFQENPRRRSQ